MCAHLKGQVKKPRGRPKGNHWTSVRDLFAVHHYERYLPWLQRRKERFGLNGWPALQKATWWDGAPHERARKMALERLRKMGLPFPMMDEAHLRNLVSASRKSR